MAQRYDVAARLAEGREAVAHTQAYVSACGRLGYRHPDLTGYDGQLIDRYDSEAGLDLRLLDTDCAALAVLADAADDVLGRQRGQLAELAAAWRGPGAEAAVEFLRRHCAAGVELTARLRAVATGCAGLRDELWRLIDAKAAAVQALDDRVGAQRPAWLAAAHTVNSGVHDEHAAEVIEKQVIPYVDNDVGGEWVSTARSVCDGVAAAYRNAAAAADPTPGVMFAIPGGLGPVWRPDEPVAASAPSPTVAPVDVPVADVPGERATAAGPAPATPPDDPPADLGVPGGLGLPADLGLPSGGLPGGLGGSGGLGGLIPRLADAFGDPRFGEPSGGPFDDHTSADDHPDDGDEPENLESEAEPADDAAEETEETGETGETGETRPAGAAPESGPEAEPQPAADTVETEHTEQTSVPRLKTPCDVAAEELPQVGQ